MHQQRHWLQAAWAHLLRDELLRDPSAPRIVRYRPALDGPDAFEIPLWHAIRWAGLIFAALATGTFLITLANALRQGPLFP